MIMCQPIVIMFILSFQTELTSTMGPGSRNRRTFETGKSFLSYVFTAALPVSVVQLVFNSLRPVSPSRFFEEASFCRQAIFDRVVVVDSCTLRPHAPSAPGSLGNRRRSWAAMVAALRRPN